MMDPRLAKELIKSAEKMEKAPDPVINLRAVLAAGFIGFARIAFAYLGPAFERGFVQAQNLRIPNALLSPEQLLHLYFVGKISREELEEELKKHGLSEENTAKLIEYQKSRLTLSEALTAYHRGILKREELDKIFDHYHVAAEDREKLLKLSEYFPGPADLIRFSVRDVYNPEIVRKYGMDKELPEKFVEEAKKLGMSEETAKKYWIAHWELPSITAGYEMLHRFGSDHSDDYLKKYEEMGLKIENLRTDLETVKTLIKRHDIEPYWRDRLVGLSYQPLTRVDLRRLYIAGLIDEKELLEGYLDLGYTKRDAELLTEFAKWEKTATGRDLSQKDIKDALSEGLITKDEALEYLEQLGYSEEEAKLKLELMEWRIRFDEIKEAIELIKTMFRKNVITYDEALAELDKLDIPAFYRDKVLQKMLKEKLKETKEPTKEDIKLFMKTKVIDESTAKEMLISIGYTEELAEKYVRAWKKSK